MTIFNVLVEDRKHDQFNVASFDSKERAWDYVKGQAQQHHGIDLDTIDEDDTNIDCSPENHLYISDREIYYSIQESELNAE